MPDSTQKLKLDRALDSSCCQATPAILRTSRTKWQNLLRKIDGATRHPRRRKRAVFENAPFAERQGNTENRANTVRPLDAATRSYCLAIAVVSGLFGIGPCLDFMMPSLFLGEEPEHPFGVVLGAGALALASLSFALYLLDCVRRCVLSRMSRSQLRRRLAKAGRSARYVVKKPHLRGARIGAYFFGTLALAYFVALLIQWVIWGV
jgi:hypothetical protein